MSELVPPALDTRLREHDGVEVTPVFPSVTPGISTRYLHKLFQGQEFSVGQWIRELRLQGAEADIRRGGPGRTLADIAYKWGFNDQAHFCRSFKTRCGRVGSVAPV
ncbi:helix-turn-helix transcriptional regulator [Zobellella iuensis]|uniref:helix-turn-helix transcriptional regulator n=1 Tax=Zobellella iuensis TaxID=2803811 RepID=UPI001F2A68DE|nr:helix-turn-helix transcriptional regulator [Zobellella iuensis]